MRLWLLVLLVVVCIAVTVIATACGDAYVDTDGLKCLRGHDVESELPDHTPKRVFICDEYEVRKK